jgi:hypothetical protein
VITGPYADGFERICTLRRAVERDYSDDDYRAQANAGLIILAVNTHELLLAELEAAAVMLAIEAKAHRQSGDEKRQPLAEPLRAQVASARAAIAIVKEIRCDDHRTA